MTDIPDIRCLICMKRTVSIEPAKIEKLAKNRFGLRTTCAVCKKGKYQFIKKTVIKLLPKHIRKLEEGHHHEGGILPLIPIILGIIAAASGVAGMTASIVQNKQKNDEQERHNKESEEIMKQAAGSGLNDAIELLQKNGYSISI